ncbi:MAG: hypothetical protein PHU63_02195 [Candidatus ainarchaeum sp.]|nr:hypothetical protein [Candidatus ainarchaeum sp.]
MEIPSTGQCIGHTLNAEEARRIANLYESKGFTAKIFEKNEAGLLLFEIWIFKKKEGLI